MKLQKIVSRKSKTKTFWKWIIILPDKLIQDMRWVKGMELEATYRIRDKEGSVILGRKI